MASAAASADAVPLNEATERVTKVGGPASLLVAQPNKDVSGIDFASAASAYREASDVTAE